MTTASTPSPKSGCGTPTTALSVTPAYLAKVGILDTPPPEDEAGVIDVQLREALDKIAFLPFGKLIDRWRWDVYAGKVEPAVTRAIQKAVGEAEGHHVKALKGALADAQQKMAAEEGST